MVQAAMRAVVNWLLCFFGYNPMPILTFDDVRAVASAIPKFNWLTDYGPIWNPESKAVWLAPESPQDLADWYAKYRPGDYGVKSAIGMDADDLLIRLNPPVMAQQQQLAAMQRPGHMAWALGLSVHNPQRHYW